MKTFLAIITALVLLIAGSFIFHLLSLPQTSNSATSEYTVMIKDIPKLNGDGDFLFNASVKNVSVKPYISKIYFNNCQFSNDLGTREASGEEKDFKNAILPGQKISVSFRFIEMWSYCIYNNSGKQICQDAKNFKLKSCRVTVSTGSGDARGIPINVTFP